MTQREAQMDNIKTLRALKRIITPNGIIIGNGKNRLLYNELTGSIPVVYKNEYGLWEIRNGSSERFSNEYSRRKIPGIGLHMKSHAIAAVALGLYDYENNLELIVNHKNYNKQDNTKKNIELCNPSENIYHGRLKKRLIECKVYKEGMSFEAKFAKYALEKCKSNSLELINCVYNYLKTGKY